MASDGIENSFQLKIMSIYFELKGFFKLIWITFKVVLLSKLIFLSNVIV